MLSPKELDNLRQKLAGYHFAKEALTPGEREILSVAEKLLKALDDTRKESASELPEELLTPVVEALNKATGNKFKLKYKHYAGWLEGEVGYETFDRAVKAFLGRKAYKEMEGLARLDAYLRFKLGVGPDNAGGIHFK